MQGEVSRDDLITGSIILAIFLAFVYVAGLLLYKVKNRRFSKAWAPLVPVINGEVEGDGGGAASSRLHGTFQGRRVRAEMAPGQGRASYQNGRCDFAIVFLDVAGRSDWSLLYYDSVRGIGKSGWRVESDDEELAERLRSMTILPARLANRTDISWRYSASRKQLEFRQDVRPLWAPAPDRFRAELEMAYQVTLLSEGVNGSAS